MSLSLSLLLSINKKKFIRKRRGVGPEISPFLKMALKTEKIRSKKEKTSNFQWSSFLNWHKESSDSKMTFLMNSLAKAKEKKSLL